MDDTLRAILILGGCLMLVQGLALQFYAMERYRVHDAPRPSFSRGPRHWRMKREWFTTDHGFRLYRAAGWSISVGSLTMSIMWLL